MLVSHIFGWSVCMHVTLEMASLSIGAPFGGPGVGLIYRGLWEKDERGSGGGASLSDEAPWRRPQGEKLLHWIPWKIGSDSFWTWASLSIGAPVVPRGTWCLGGRLEYRGLWKMDEGGSLLVSLRYVKQGSEMGVFFGRGPTFAEHGWAFLS